MNEYYDYGRDFERELECEMEKWNCGYHTPEVLHNIKDLMKVITLLQEKEAGEAMREYLEDEHGYDSHTGDFRERMKYNPYGVYNMADPKRPMRSGDKGSYPYRTGKEGNYPREYERGRRSGDMRDYDDYNRDGRYPPEMYGIWNHGDESKMREKKDKLTDKEYKEWAEHLENEDGTTGPIWTEDETTSLGKKVGVDFNKISKVAYWLTCNMMYSDFCEIFEKLSMNKPEVYAQLAWKWLDDSDTIDGEKKLAAYHEYIVE